VNNPLKKIKPTMNNHQKLRMKFRICMMYCFEVLRYGSWNLGNLESGNPVILELGIPESWIPNSKIPGFPDSRLPGFQ
jgi:hypothetical protein